MARGRNGREGGDVKIFKIINSGTATQQRERLTGSSVCLCSMWPERSPVQALKMGRWSRSTLEKTVGTWNIRVHLQTLAFDLHVFALYSIVSHGRLYKEAFTIDWQQHADAVGKTSSAGVWLCETTERRCRRAASKAFWYWRNPTPGHV